MSIAAAAESEESTWRIIVPMLYNGN